MKHIKYILPITSFILSFILDIEVIAILLLIYIIFLYFTEIRVLKRLKSKYLIIFFVVLLFIYPLTGNRSDINLPFGLNYDFILLLSSMKMCFRALLLMLFFNQLIMNVKNLNLKQIGNRVGFNNYDEILTISERLFPTLKNQIFILINEIKNSIINLKSPSNIIANFLANLLTVNNSNNK